MNAKKVFAENSIKLLGYVCSECNTVFTGDHNKHNAMCCCTDKGVCAICNKICEVRDNPFSTGLTNSVCTPCLKQLEKEEIKRVEKLYLKMNPNKKDKFFLFDDEEQEFSSIKEMFNSVFSQKDYDLSDLSGGVQRYGKEKSIDEHINKFFRYIFDDNESTCFSAERNSLKILINKWYKKLPPLRLEYEEYRDGLE